METNINTLKKQGKIHYAWFIMLACCAFQIACTGIYSNSASIFYAPVTKTIGATRADMALMMSIKNILLIIMLPFVGKIIEKFNLKIVYTIAILLMGVSFTLQSTFNSIYSFWIGAAVLGLGSSVLTYIAVPFLINNWFQKNVGLAMGVAMACTGIGSMIFNPLGGWLIDAYGWRTGYWVLGLCGLVIALPFSIFVLKSHPSKMGLLKYGDTGEKTITGEIIATALKGLPLKQAMKSPAFYIVIIATLSLTLIANMQIHIAGHVQSLGYKSVVAGSVMFAVSIGTLLGKPLWGFLTDKMGSAATVIIAECVTVACAILFLMGTSMMFLYAAGFLFGLTYVMITIHPAMVVRGLFGNLEYGSIYSYIVYGNAAAAVIGAPFYGWIYDHFGSYTYSFYVLIGLAVTTVLLYLWGLSYKKKLQSTWEIKKSA